MHTVITIGRPVVPEVTYDYWSPLDGAHPSTTPRFVGVVNEIKKDGYFGSA